MANELEPLVGKWYENLENDEKFEVLALDEDTGIVKVRYEDGSDEEMDIDVWYGLDIERCAEPEGWDESFDDDEEEDWDDDEDDPDDSDKDDDDEGYSYDDWN